MINKVHCMDCLEGMKALDDNSIDLAFTSPPYNRIRNDKYKNYNDNNVDYFDLLVDSTDLMLKKTRGYTIVNIQQNAFNKKEFFNYLGHYSEKINGIFVWKKTNPQPSTNFRAKSNDYSITNAIEYFIFIKDGKEFRAKEKTQNFIESSVNSLRFEGHGAVMKKEVASFFIEMFSDEGDLVLDPFGGMGTTGVVCKEKRRDFILFEKSKEYADKSRDRIEKHNYQEDLFNLK